MVHRGFAQEVAHYRIVERIGEGGMGEVYKAVDLRLNRIVALKFIAQQAGADDCAQQRLLEEAQAAAALNHPHIATVYELGQANGLSFIAMEHVAGESLARLIERGPLPIGTALDIAMQIAEALDAAHARGIVHCDIKATNVILTSDGSVKVFDFGLARIIFSSARQSSDNVAEEPANGCSPAQPATPTIHAVIEGTASYMSPEQARGLPVDARTDLFSLGVLLYEMVAGRKPFPGKHPQEILHAILNDEAAPLGATVRDAPLELESILRKALEKDRLRRYPSARAMLADLRKLQRRIEPPMVVEPATALYELAASDSSAARGEPFWLKRAARFRQALLAAGAIAALAPVLRRFIFALPGDAWMIDAALLGFAVICVMSYKALGKRRARLNVAAPVGAAFRGLLPFQEADRHRFFGREAETHALFAMIAHGDFRFGVLFGESGSGKTSLLKASVLPRLREAGFVPLYCRSYKDPVTSLIDECRRQSGLAIGDAEEITDYLKRVCREMCAPVVVVCDQFEEFFVNHKTRRERQPLIALVGQCYNDDKLAVKFLFSLRSDFLYTISSEFAGCVPEPLTSAWLFHLHNFDEQQAAEIIDKSARIAGLPFEPGLSRVVARDLAIADAVLPSELQIIGERLQSRRIYTAQDYRRVGGKEPLVYTFLDDVMQTSGDQESARLLLRTLISDESTRLTLTLDEIARRTQRSRQAVERILTLFVSARLVREIQEDEGGRYELMHEYLIAKINQITGRVMDATQRANRLFRQYLANYTVDRRTRIPIGKLWFIRRYSDVQRGNRERELLSKSLRLGLIKASLLTLLLVAAATVAAAALSVSEEWESRRLSDGHTAAVRQAVFSPDGKRLVSCGEDKQVIVWDFARRERLATLTDHEDIIVGVAFSPDGKWLATASRDETVIVRDAATLEKAFVLREPIAAIMSLAFSTDGKFLVAMGSQGVSWRVGHFEKVAEMKQVASSDFAFLPHSSKFTTVSHHNEITFCDAATGKSETCEVVGALGGWAAISPDGRIKMSVDSQGRVQFVDIARCKVLDAFAAHKDNGRSVAFSPDGKLAASASEKVILWDVRTRTKIATLEHESLVWSVAFSPDGRWLVSTHADGAILIWNVVERQRVANLNEHSGAVYAVAYSRDGSRIASTGEDSSVIIWDAATGHKEAVLIGHKSRANGIAFLPDGQQVIACGFQEPLIQWDSAHGVILRTFISPPAGMPGSNGFAVSADGRWAATSNGVYNIADSRMVCIFYDKTENDDASDDWISMNSQIYGLDFSKDGRLLACSTVYACHIGLIDTSNWEVIAHAQAPDSPFISLSFSPDGKYLATGDDNGNVELWNVSPLERLAVMGRHAARVKAVAFSPDGRQVVSSSDDKTIALWNVSSRSLAARIGTHAAPVRAVAFSPDGKHIVSGEHDKSVRIHTRHRVLWGYRLD
jgi:WD40 repeat protein/tRNA A-37 threonylcarbamoyl transferase component Bud32/predicted transcriptional regulator